MKFAKALVSAAILSSTMAASTAMADLSANVGYASEYYFRGILQKESAASAGLDYENSGFYVGTWAADVGDGLEYDLYGGYGMEFDSGLSVGLGYAGYFYTGEFDDTYTEGTLSLGYGGLSLAYTVGTWDGGDVTEDDYDFFQVSYEFENGLYGTYGTFGDEADGDYFEIGYGTTISEIDFGVAAIFSSEELSDQVNADGEPVSSEALVFTISKSFDL